MNTEKSSQKIWKKPHVIKIYEALSAIIDKRIEKEGTNFSKIKCCSTSRNKYYSVEFNPQTNEIMSNDNSAYYTDTLSYPMIALLILNNNIHTEKHHFSILKDIKWKDINQKFKNNYDNALEYVLKTISELDIKEFPLLQAEVDHIYKQILSKDYYFLGKKRFPPQAY